MTTGTKHVAFARDGQPKRRLVLNAFVEMCMLACHYVRFVPISDADSLQAPAIRARDYGSTLTITLQTSIRSNTGLS